MKKGTFWGRKTRLKNRRVLQRTPICIFFSAWWGDAISGGRYCD
nr:hypothetical protein [Providencia rettgeri]